MKENNRHAGSPGKWVVVEGRHEGRPLIARFDGAYRDASARGKRNIQIGVAIPLKRPSPEGLPDADEIAALDSIEDEIVSSAERRAVLVGVITTSGMREYVLYSATGDWIAAFHKGLQQAVRTHEVQCMAKTDPTWAVYRQFVS